MKITKDTLKRIIKEEYNRLTNENYFSGQVHDLTAPQGADNAPLTDAEVAKAKSVIEKTKNERYLSNDIHDLRNAFYNQFNKEQPPYIYNKRAAEVRAILAKLEK